MLRLIESFSLDDVRAAISEALERGVIGFDAVKHLVLCRIEEAAATLEPAGPSLSAARRGGNNLGPLVHGAPEGGSAMSDTPQLLLAHHLKALKLPTFLREYDKQARQCAAEGVDHVRYLVRLTELELIDRERRMVERRIRMAKFPAVKSLDSFDFKAMPSLNKMMVLELARCEYIERRENVIALGNSGTGKTHIALGLGLAACQKGLTVGFITAAALVHELIEARDEKRLLRFQKQLAKYKLLIIDELGFVPLSKTGAELLFEVFSQRYEGGSTLVTSNLPFDEWTEVFGSERLTGALLDRLTHHVHILEMNGDSYRLNQSQKRRQTPKNLTTQPMVDPVGPQAPPTLLSLRVTQALHEAARVPPMDYRDNRQRWAESHQVVHFLRRPVVYFYSGVDNIRPGSGFGGSLLALRSRRKSKSAGVIGCDVILSKPARVDPVPWG